MKLNAEYWEHRYQHAQTGWDIGYPSDPIINYANQLGEKDLKILIPGAGNAYEAGWLHTHGFSNITVIDIAASPLQNLKAHTPGFPADNILQTDFFDHCEKYDLILEQTFFCALPPERRPDYVRKMHELLNTGGKLAGLLFDFPNNGEGPPFGGSMEEYQELFSPFFHLRVLERSYNSIKPRQGKELFFIFEKKQA